MKKTYIAPCAEAVRLQMDGQVMITVSGKTQDAFSREKTETEGVSSIWGDDSADADF